MRYLAIVLFLILSSCKSESKTENGIDETVSRMWDDFTELNPEFKNEELPESFYFHNNEKDANRLSALVLKGQKKASSNLYFWYEEANADLPKIGTKSIVTDFDGKARAIIKIIKVDTVPFNQISEAYAEMDMGTNIEPLQKWKKAHWDFFSKALGENGVKPTEDMLMVCEYFETIWPLKDKKTTSK